jgi:ActR/RegA family two-component response regulator
MKSFVHITVPSAGQRAANDRGGSEGWLLIVDDDRMTGRALARWVTHVTGCAVRVARTVHQAECWLRVTHAPLAMISDFELGGETGLDAIRRVRELGVLCPAAIVTGAPEKASAAVEQARLSETLPIFSKAAGHERLAHWLSQLRFGWAASA